MLVQRSARHVVLAPERLRVALDRDHVHGAGRWLLERAQVVADQPERARDGDRRVVERRDQRRHEVAGGSRLVSTSTTTPADARRMPGVQRGRVPQPGAGPDDLDAHARRSGRLGVELGERRLLGVRRPVRDDDQLGAVGRAIGQGADGPGEILRPVGRDEHDRGDAHRGVLETRRHRRARPVADDAGVDQVGCRGSLERVQRRRVDHLPAGGLDLRAQRVGGRPVPGPSRRRPRVGQRSDLGGCLVS